MAGDWVVPTTTNYPNWTTTTTANDLPYYINWPQPISIEKDCGQSCVVLRDSKGVVIGRIYLGLPEQNDLEFFGNSSESTQIFLKAIQNAANEYLKKNRTAMIEKLISDLESVERSIKHFNEERYGAMDKIIDTIKEHIVAIQSI